MKPYKATIYKAADGWRWRMKAPNGRIVCTGESHTRRTDAFRAASRLIEALRYGPTLVVDARE